MGRISKVWEDLKVFMPRIPSFAKSRELAYLRQNQARGRSLVDRVVERTFISSVHDFIFHIHRLCFCD
jgi:hypothetical protein